MRRNNFLRTIVTIAIIVWACLELVPSYKLSKYKELEETKMAELVDYTKLQPAEIGKALSTGSLALEVRDLGFSTDSLNNAQKLSAELVDLHEKVLEYQSGAIKQGLDLQGGTYLVYEVDLPGLMRTVSKNQDATLDSLIAVAKASTVASGGDFLATFQAGFDQANIRMNRYFGKRSQDNDEIASELGVMADDVIDRTLEVLRNRIDEFGVAEPNIAKQGSRRVLVELAGVSDVERAKDLIGKTALLEFKLVKEPQIASRVLQDINEAWQKRLDRLKTNDSAKSKEGEVKTADGTGQESVLGDNIIAGGESAQDAADLSVNSDFVNAGKPFFALLRRLGNSMTVPKENKLTVERILNDEAVRAVIPADTEIKFYGKPDIQDEKEFYRFEILNTSSELTGKYLTNADVTLSSGTQSLSQGEPQVSIKFNSEGGRIFGRVTGANVNRRLAIVMDGSVYSAPNITEKIASGDAVIHGSFDMVEAKELAIVLRAGSLPAPVEAIHQSTVGPSLGADSVRQGKQSILIGISLVIIFMLVYYKGAGFVADSALILNLLIILAVLAARGATLTLPGVAGIILTMGMAVDANVLIFERIREELQIGKTVRAAIDAGYGRAFWTIFDANITTMLTAIVLYQFGTGPIRGFALTLTIGIIASMFTAIVVTRLIFDFMTQKKNIAKLSI